MAASQAKPAAPAAPQAKPAAPAATQEAKTPERKEIKVTEKVLKAYVGEDMAPTAS